MVMARSALAVTVVVLVELLFPAVGSAVVDDTVAVFETVPAKLGAVEYVEVMLTICPFVIVPGAHGYAVVQPPLFEMNVNAAGVGSATVTLEADDGPLFVTVIV